LDEGVNVLSQVVSSLREDAKEIALRRELIVRCCLQITEPAFIESPSVLLTHEPVADLPAMPYQVDQFQAAR
jgi:hypothetical protein